MCVCGGGGGHFVMGNGLAADLRFVKGEMGMWISGDWGREVV